MRRRNTRVSLADALPVALPFGLGKSRRRRFSVALAAAVGVGRRRRLKVDPSLVDMLPRAVVRRRGRREGFSVAVPAALALGRSRRGRRALSLTLPVALEAGRLKRRFAPAAAAAAVPLAYVGLVRPWLSHLGATKDEADRALPGDGLVAGARSRSTMAATLDAPPEDVWPWLVQMGRGRAGWYSIDRLDLFGEHSADTVHPEWQRLEVGDRLPSSPDRTWFDVSLLEPSRVLGLTARVDLRRGRSVPVGEPLPRLASESSWVFVLEPTDGATRLLVRTAGRQRPWPIALVNPFGWLPVHALMQAGQLRGLRARVERGPRDAPERAADVPLAVAA